MVVGRDVARIVGTVVCAGTTSDMETPFFS
jgi:hypothetical protein